MAASLLRRGKKERRAGLYEKNMEENQRMGPSVVSGSFCIFYFGADRRGGVEEKRASRGFYSQHLRRRDPHGARLVYQFNPFLRSGVPAFGLSDPCGSDLLCHYPPRQALGGAGSPLLREFSFRCLSCLHAFYFRLWNGILRGNHR